MPLPGVQRWSQGARLVSDGDDTDDRSERNTEGPTSSARLREVLDASARAFAQRTDRDGALFDELSRLNNELSTTQRQLIKSNHALALANEELRANYEALPVGIVRTDLTGRIMRANALFVTITGCGPGDAWYEGSHPDDREMVIARWQRDSAEGALFQCEYRRLLASGEIGELELTLTPIADAGGTRAGFVGVVEDVSVSRQLARQSRELEREADLRRLIGQLAHHLNNIMTVVIGAADEVVDALPVDDRLAEGARLGSLAAQRAARLVQALMIYSGAATLWKQECALEAILEEIAERERRSLPAGVALVTDFRSGNATVRLPRDLFVEALEGLLANAREAVGERGRITLASRWVGTESGTRQIAIRVSDDGIGMNRETLRRAPEPFFTTHVSGQSTGLGVPLADGFARHSGGSLRIASEFGEGTQVELVLPAGP